MNAVFTIVAKNYLPLARTLGDSLAKYHPEIPFFIVIADELKGDIDIPAERYKIVEATQLGVPGLKDLAFKYNVTEYCTALKPFAFSYFFREFKFDKLIYFDPDICVFNRLDAIFEALNTDFIVLTPHFLTPELEYTGTVPEGDIMFLGMFNLGFAAINNSEKGLYVINWWQNRLVNGAYGDRISGFHTDQKWMDFMPVLFDNGVCILRKLGYNMAFWNIHERYLCALPTGEGYEVQSRLETNRREPLVFFHFAGFDPHDLTNVHKYNPAFPLEDFPDLQPLMQFYKNAILQNGYDTLISIPYSYGAFENGININSFQRRLYRSLTENGYTFENPFALGANSFYELLKKNRLLTQGTQNTDKVYRKNLRGVEQKIVLLYKVMRFFKRILGFERYTLLLRFALRVSRPENQTFLIKEIGDKIGFVPEEAYPPGYKSKIKEPRK